MSCAIAARCVLYSERDSDTPPQNVRAGVLERTETKGGSKVFGLCTGKGFGQDVGLHVFSRAKLEIDLAFADDPSDEVEAHVDVLGSRMELVIFSECDRGLIVRVE